MICRLLKPLIAAAISVACTAPQRVVAADPTAAPSTTPASSLSGLTLEELMGLQVSTVSRKSEPWWTASGALDVVFEEDIRRSGVFTLPDALRLAAGVHVGQINARDWAVGIRGFNVVSGNKLNVQIDGRSVFTPFFSGVLWDAQDTLLEDIDRIEVMRGPAAALWGAHALNGFIQVLTKPAWATQGTLVTAATGTEMPALFALRHGGKLSDRTFYRVYAKYSQFDWSYGRDGAHTRPTADFGQVGFRTDTRATAGGILTLQGDAYSNKGLPKDRPQNEISGANLSGNWSRDMGVDSNLRITGYYDYTSKGFLVNLFERRHTASGSVKFHRMLGRHDFQAGADALVSRDRIEGSSVFLDPPRRTFHSMSLFGHDTITLDPRHVAVTFGAQALHAAYSGWEVQPTVRLAWTPSPRTTLWAATSRAVRPPIRLDEDLVAMSGEVVTFRANNQVKPEKVIAWEMGARRKFGERLAATLAVFFNDYEDVRSYESATSTDPAFPWTFKNTTNVRTSGFEVMALSQPIGRLFIKLVYRYLDFTLTKDPGSGDFQNGLFEANDPRHVTALMTRLDLPYNVEFDMTFRHASRLPNPAVPGYVTADARVAWRPRLAWELALIGRNLFEPQLQEFVTAAGVGDEIARSLTLKATWRF